MKIKYSPQVNEEQIRYEFDGDVITATICNFTDTFDFSEFPDGELKKYDEETGEELIKTNLPINPIISAKRENGVLSVVLLNWIGTDASEEERFPDWIEV